MKIDVQREGSRSVVRVTGDIDLSNSPKFRDLVINLYRKRRQSLVIVDLEQVQHIDSSAIASLVEAHREATEKGARLALVGVHEGIRGVLDLSNLIDIFEIHASADEVPSAVS